MDAEVFGGTGAPERGLDPRHDRDREDAPHRVRAFGRVAMALAPALWGVLHFLWGHPRAALWAGGGVLAWGLLSFAAPVPMGPVLRTWARVTRPLGIVVTTALLGVVYYVVLTPVALLRRALRPDPLDRAPRRGGKQTYWRRKDLPPPESPRWYRPF